MHGKRNGRKRKTEAHAPSCIPRSKEVFGHGQALHTMQHGAAVTFDAARLAPSFCTCPTRCLGHTASRSRCRTCNLILPAAAESRGSDNDETAPAQVEMVSTRRHVSWYIKNAASRVVLRQTPPGSG